ncbi:MAG: extracellular solute-binding protein [Rubricoccaceae bacterium]
MRRLASLLLVAVLAPLVSACDTAERRPERGPIVVRLWHQKDSAERAFLEAAVARYNAAQDSVRVETLYKETEELRNHYVFAAIGGRGPDLVYGPADNVGTLGLTETIRPLDGLLPVAFLEGFDEEGLLYWDGRLVAVADQVGNHLTFVYNRALIQTPPTTFDELVALGQRLRDGGRGPYLLAWNYTEPFFFIPFLTAYGGWVMDEQGNPTLNTEATVNAIQFVLDLRDRYGLIPRESDYESVKVLFRDGAAAAVIDGPWSWAGYGEAGVDYALAPLPLNTATGRYAEPMAAAKAYSVNPAVPAWKLPAVLGVLEFLTDDAMQAAMAEQLATIPVRRAVRQSDVMTRNPVLQQSLAQAERTQPMPTAPQMRQIWDAMRGPYQLVMNGSISAREGARLMQAQAERQIAEAFGR